MTTPPFSMHSAKERRLIGDSANAVLFAYLDTVGNGSGTINMAAAATSYLTKPAAGEVWLIEHIRIIIASAAPVDGVKFGAIAALANGCKLEVRSGLASPLTISRDLTAGKPIKDNVQLAALGDTEIFNFSASSLISCHIKHTLRLTGDYGDALYFQTQDSLVTLSAMYVAVDGLRFKN